MARVQFSLTGSPSGSDPLLFGIPFDTPEQTVLSVNVLQGQYLGTVQAENSGQTALRIEPDARRAVIEVEFSDHAGAYPDWLFTPTGGRHEMPSEALAQMIASLTAGNSDAASLDRIIAHVDERFVYGRRDQGLGDDTDAMPALVCDTNAGTCVDTHSYAVAAVRAAGIDAAYISGVFFKDGQTVSAPGHCWFATIAEGHHQHWDSSHHIKYGLGPTRAVYNPLPGTRFALTAGRDLVFCLPQHRVTVSTLKGFIDVSAAHGQALATEARLL